MNIIEGDLERPSAFFGTLKRLIGLGKYIGSNIKHIIKKFKKRHITMDNKHKRTKLERFVANNNNLIEALLFFKNNSGSIDVLIKNGIE